MEYFSRVVPRIKNQLLRTELDRDSCDCPAATRKRRLEVQHATARACACCSQSQRVRREFRRQHIASPAAQLAPCGLIETGPDRALTVTRAVPANNLNRSHHHPAAPTLKLRRTRVGRFHEKAGENQGYCRTNGYAKHRLLLEAMTPLNYPWILLFGSDDRKLVNHRSGHAFSPPSRIQIEQDPCARL